MKREKNIQYQDNDWSAEGWSAAALFNLGFSPSAFDIKSNAKCHIQLKFYVLEEWAAYAIVFSLSQNRIRFRVDKRFHVQFASIEIIIDTFILRKILSWRRFLLRRLSPC